MKEREREKKKKLLTFIDFCFKSKAAQTYVVAAAFSVQFLSESLVISLPKVHIALRFIVHDNRILLRKDLLEIRLLLPFQTFFVTGQTLITFITFNLLAGRCHKSAQLAADLLCFKKIPETTNSAHGILNLPRLIPKGYRRVYICFILFQHISWPDMSPSFPWRS